MISAAAGTLFTFKIYFIQIIIHRDDDYIEIWLFVLNQQRSWKRGVGGGSGQNLNFNVLSSQS